MRDYQSSLMLKLSNWTVWPTYKLLLCMQSVSQYILLLNMNVSKLCFGQLKLSVCLLLLKHTLSLELLSNICHHNIEYKNICVKFLGTFSASDDERWRNDVGISHVYGWLWGCTGECFAAKSLSQSHRINTSFYFLSGNRDRQISWWYSLDRRNCQKIGLFEKTF